MSAHFIVGRVLFMEPLIAVTTGTAAGASVTSGIVGSDDVDLNKNEYRSSVSAFRAGNSYYVNIGGVTLEVKASNYPAKNGVIHYVTGIGNFVYQSALDLISTTATMVKFNTLIQCMFISR